MTPLFSSSPLSFLRKKQPVKIESNDAEASKKITVALNDYLKDAFFSEKHSLVVLCIGTDRSTGDSLGPLIGTALARRLPFFPLYGTLDDPVHAVNLADKLDKIKDEHREPFIIAIDACLGRLDNVGKIDVGLGSLQPGAGVNKNLPQVGNVFISGIVNVGGFLEYFVLQNTRLSVVMSLAEVITEGLYNTIKSYNKEKTGAF